MSESGHAKDGEVHGGGHVVPVWVLVAIWGALMLLTALTVAVAQVGFGKWYLWIAMSIASVKAILVVLFFMHLAWDRGINILIFVGSLIFVFLFVGIAMMDTLEYKPDLIPIEGMPANR